MHSFPNFQISKFSNFIFWLSLIYVLPAYSEIEPKHYTVKPLTTEIKIDGIPDDVAWRSAFVADSFIQYEPSEGAAVTQKTEVKVLFDNTAIYVLGIMYDTHADSILHELGNRDEDGNLNSDYFRFGVDPYNKRANGYVFEVSASGVQSESFDNDITFDAVWQSAVHISDSGWTAELKIPYSAIRFPALPEQHWGAQFARLIRRNREYDQWTLTPKNIQNRLLFWGTLDGISNVNPPLRLSLTPYFSVYAERAPVVYGDNSTSYENSRAFSGGADIKYGIDERFTLDMTLLPDFSQVQSDNKVKNISAFETIYDEKRPFFKEGTALFSKGNLFYSRRIGNTPSLYYDVQDSLTAGEKIIENPDKARLTNSTKISGRTNGGLGIGLLNAVTANTYAVISDEGGNKRKILTEPLSNFNLFIFDQQLKNNCNVFLVNTNVMRNGKARDANVTSGEGRFENKNHQYRLTFDYSVSHVYEWKNNENGINEKEEKKGELITLSADKISGKSWYGASYEIGTKNYDRNDLGIIFITDYSYVNTYYTYNMFNPFWRHFKQGSVTLYASRGGRLSMNNQLTELNIGLNFFLLFNSNWSLYATTGFHPIGGRDYYEPRIEEMFYKSQPNNNGSLNFTTNYNRKLAFDFGARYSVMPFYNNTGIGYYIIPRIRFSDHLSLTFYNYLDKYNNDIGFAYTSAGNDSSFFGQRNIITIENTITSRYIFKNDMSLSLSARHYWSRGTYEKFYNLESSGELLPVEVDDLHAYDFNSNYLTVDIVYNWQFAPGSSFLITYKNLILSETLRGDEGYFKNLKQTFSDLQTNSISLKVLYYLDYQYFKKK